MSIPAGVIGAAGKGREDTQLNQAIHQDEQKGKEARPLSTSKDDDFIRRKLAFYDKDNSGWLDAKELVTVMTDLNKGVPPSEEDVKSVLAQTDVDGNGRITQDELMKVMVVWFASVQKRRANAPPANTQCECIIS